MRQAIFRNIIRIISFYRKDVAYQIIIIAVLAAVISASLFTGNSVRNSLKISSQEKLGNTDIIISSGVRYLDPSLAGKINSHTGDNITPILETDGFCQSFSTSVTALNTKIYGVTKDFFTFQGNDSIDIKPGSVAINVRLAEHLGINRGDEIIIYFREADPIPANAPFSSGSGNRSKVFKVGRILNPGESGNFSLGINQLTPFNVFVNLNEIGTEVKTALRANRLLVKNISGNSDTSYLNVLHDLISPSDIGLSLRKSDKTGEPELISDRIFIDSVLVETVLRVFPDASPVLTYLANSISKGAKSTPYSFVSALPPSLYSGIDTNRLVVSRWLANDLDCKEGDTIDLSYYCQVKGNRLEENNKSFIVSEIIGDDHYYSDPSLMPDFPGISGSTTCSGWDAGIPILLDRIRKEDEEYWNIRRGTPKAFISYTAGEKIWSNDFGIATAIRFPKSMDINDIERNLKGKIDPMIAGITVSGISGKAEKAAAGGVDFSTLFLSLSIFIILSSIILLLMAISVFFNSRKSQIRMLHALGYRNRIIRRTLITETMIIAIAGTIPGALAGYLINILLVFALNTVWKGAVQTNMLSPEFSLLPMISGIIVTIFITFIIVLIKTYSFLKSLAASLSVRHKYYQKKRNYYLLGVSIASSVILFVLSYISKENSILYSFTGGSVAFIAFILLLRLLLINPQWHPGSMSSFQHFSRKFYALNPSNATTPVVFIAASLFAVIIAGSNRQVISDKMLLPQGGTGGYLLWAESAIPVKENLNTKDGRTEFGLYEPELADLSFVQSRRLSGDDASCLNLNHVTAPSILGLDPEPFISKGSFSFASMMKGFKAASPWKILNSPSVNNTIYGIADQTVLEWGLKMKPGDTLKFNAENGHTLNIIICAGLKSSVFQGYVLISEKNFSDFFPSVAGYSVFLADGKTELSDNYQSILADRLSLYGFSVEPAGEKLASFFQVTNTYLDVFTILGALGMILGITGLGFILLRNFDQRRQEFALMIACGITIKEIRKILIRDHTGILFWGILTGLISALSATYPSLNSGAVFPWGVLVILVFSLAAVGLAGILLVIKSIKQETLVSQLRRE